MKNTTYTFEAGEMKTTVTDQPEPTKADILRTRLTIHVTAYDYAIRRRSFRNARAYHNPFALPQYLDAVNRVVEAVTNGIGIEQALRETFIGHMLNYLLRKVAR